MDMDDILSRFGNLPGQVPDVLEEESPFHRLARLDSLEDRMLVDMYRRQGLPVDECETPEIFVLEPLSCSRAKAGHPVLFEPGSFTKAGSMEAVCRQRTLAASWKPEATWRETSVRLQIFELQHKGVSMLDSPGGRFWDPEADAACYAAIRQNLKPGIPLIELDHNINDLEFADAIAKTLLGLLSA